MVETAQNLEVRPVGADAFDEIYPLLALFDNRKMEKQHWREMLFTYAWWDGPIRGYALYAGREPVGFIGTIFSHRHVSGRDEVFCNTSCWIVRPEYRRASILLVKAVLGLRDCTIVNLTPTERSYAIFEKVGFRPLESEQLLLLPAGSPLSSFSGSFTTDRSRLQHGLAALERTIFEQLSSSPRVHHVLLERGGRSCYVVATRKSLKRIPLAEIQYIGDPDFFWENRALAHAAFLRVMGVAALAVDRRFTGGRRIPFALRRPAKRLYRPLHRDTPPELIDGLYSEMMTLQI